MELGARNSSLVSRPVCVIYIILLLHSYDNTKSFNWMLELVIMEIDYAAIWRSSQTISLAVSFTVGLYL